MLWRLVSSADSATGAGTSADADPSPGADTASSTDTCDGGSLSLQLREPS